jgi:hypothetical protein
MWTAVMMKVIIYEIKFFARLMTQTLWKNTFLEYAISLARLWLNLGSSRACEASKKVFFQRVFSVLFLKFCGDWWKRKSPKLQGLR